MPGPRKNIQIPRPSSGRAAGGPIRFVDSVIPPAGVSLVEGIGGGNVDSRGTTEGDLLVFDFDTLTFERLAVGTNGQVLTADSTQDQGVKWAAGGGGGSGVTVVGAANGATDHVAFNTALTAAGVAGGVVKGTAGQSYVFAAPVVIPSNVTLDISGCTVTRAAGYTAGPIIQNEAASPQRTVTDGVMNASSATLTSATAAFVTSDAGRAILVSGVGVVAYPNLYTTILTVNSGTSVTLAVAANTSLAGCTVSLFGRDSNIGITGDASTIINCGSVTGSTYNAVMHIFLRRIDGLALDGGMAQVNAPNSCGPIRAGDVTELRIKDWRGDITVSDFIHVNGPAKDFSITNIFGNTGDDFVALAPVDLSQYSDCYGDITDGYVGRLFARGTGNLVDFYQNSVSAQNGNPVLKRVTVETVRGTGAVGVMCNVTAIDDLTIRDIKMQPGVTAGVTNSVVQVVAASTGSLKIEEITALSVVGTSGTQAAIVSLSLAGDVAGSGGTGTAAITVSGIHVVSGDYFDVVQLAKFAPITINKLSVEDVDLQFRPVHTARVVAAGVGNNGTVGELVVSGSALIAPGNLCTLATILSGITVSALRIRGAYAYGLLALVDLASGATCSRVEINGANCLAGLYGIRTAISTDVTFTACNLSGLSNESALISGGSVTVRFAATDTTGATAAVSNTGTGAVRVLADNATSTIASSLINSGGGTLSVNGPTISCNLALPLTPNDGDMVYNANGGLACGVGVVVYNVAAGHWKNLYTGSTY